MKRRNGFVFIETMITVVILSTALLIIYSLFNSMIIREKRRSYFDDPAYIYRAGYLSTIFEQLIRNSSYTPENISGPLNISDLLNEYTSSEQAISGTPHTANLRIFTCSNDIFKASCRGKTGNELNQCNNERETECNSFFADNQIYRIYLSKYDLSYVDTCDNDSGRSGCDVYRTLSNQAKLYFRQLPYTSGVESYYLIFEFNDNGKNGQCVSDTCMHQFASFLYGNKTSYTNLSN